MSSLAGNCVFYKPENAKGTPWNWILKILKYKNEIFKRVELKKYKRERGHLPLCSLPELVIKISKLAHFLIFSADDSKKSVTVRAKFLSTSERCYLAHQKILWIIGIWATISKMSTLENTGFLVFLSWLINFDISTISILQTINSKSLNHIIQWRNLIRSFRCTWLYCQYCD